MNKFEKLIEYIINDEDQKARELFHDIVVEKSRDIYESIMDEEQMGAAVHGAEVEEMVDAITKDEEVGESDEEGEEEFSLDADGEEDGEVAGEMPSHDGEEAEHEEIEDKVMNIDAKLDELLAKFDEIMGDEGHSEEPAMHDEMPAMDHAETEMFEAEDCDDEEEEEEEESKEPKKTEESKSRKLSTSEMMREYVDRIGDIYGGTGDATEGDAVGAAGKKTSVNTKPGSIGPGNNFGGTAVTSKGGAQDQDGTSPTKASNEYTKGQGEIKSGNRNVPGGKADSLESTGTKYETEHKPEGKLAGADGSRPVNAKSVQAQNTGKK